MHQKREEPGCAAQLAGYLALGVVALIVWVISNTAPVSLFLLAAVAVYFGARRTRHQWAKPLIPFLGASAVGFAIVWLLDLFFWIVEPNLEVDTLSRADRIVLAATRWLKEHTSLSWGATVTTVAILGIASYYAHHDLLQPYLRAKKRVALVTTTLTVICSFTFLAEPLVIGPISDARREHYEAALREAEAKREDDVRKAHQQREVALRHEASARAGLVAIQTMTSGDLEHLRALARAVAEESGVHIEPHAVIESVLDASAPVVKADEVSESASNAKDDPEKARAKAQDAEREAAAEEKALEVIVEKTAGAVEGVVFDTLWDLVKTAVFSEENSFGALAKTYVDHAIDIPYDRYVAPRVGAVAEDIRRRLRPKHNQSATERVDVARGSIIRKALTDYAEETRSYADTVDLMDSAARRGDESQVARSAKVVQTMSDEIDATRKHLMTDRLLDSTTLLPASFRSIFGDSMFESLSSRIRAANLEAARTPTADAVGVAKRLEERAQAESLARQREQEIREREIREIREREIRVEHPVEIP